MRLRTLIGFGVGYVLGARSDKKRLESLQQTVETVVKSPVFKGVMEQAKQMAATGMEQITGQQPQWAQAGNGHAKQQAQQASQGQEGQEQEKQGQQGQQSEQAQQGQQSEQKEGTKSREGQDTSAQR